MATTEAANKEREIRQFAAILLDINRGKFHDQLSVELADLVKAVRQTGKKGVYTLKLTVAPFHKGNLNNLVLTGQSTANTPKDDDAVGTAIFFHDEDGNLLRDDPNQPTLPTLQQVKNERTTD